MDRLQRRDLQLPLLAAAVGRRRPSLPHPERYGSHRPPLRRRRAAVPGPPQRHVRPGLVGRPPAAIAAGPRPAGQEAAGLSRRAGAAAVRQRVEEPVGGAGRAPGNQPPGHRRLPDLSVRPPSANDLPWHPQVAPRPLRPLSPRPPRRTTLLERRFQSPGGPARPGVRRAVAQPVAVVGRVAVAERGAAGGLSLRRHRFQHRGGPDAGIDEPAGADVLHRLQRARV